MSPQAVLVVDAIGWSLVHFVWQGALVAGLLAATLSLLPNAKPQTRYLLACSALMICMGLPIATFSNAAAGFRTHDMQIVSGTHLLGVAAASATDPVTTWVRSNMSTLVLTWLCGVALLTARVGVGLVWVTRTTAQASVDMGPVWARSFENLTGRFGLRRRVAWKVVEGLAAPMTTGWWRPIVFVPAALMSGFPVALLEALLAHELAHIKRHDYLVNLLQTMIEVLLFFHPAIWWISRQIRVEREELADDLAARALGEPRDLALALQRLELLCPSVVSLTQAAAGGDLVRRIKRLIDPGRRPMDLKSAIGAAAVLIAGVAICAHAANPGVKSEHLAAQTPGTVGTGLWLEMTVQRDGNVVARPTVLLHTDEVAAITAGDITLGVVATALNDSGVVLALDVRTPSDRLPVHTLLKARMGDDISATQSDDAGRHYRITVKPSLASTFTPHWAGGPR